MQITVDLPDDIARRPNPGREALEALVIEGYRSEKFNHYQAARLLGMTRFEFDGFLKDRGIYDHAYPAGDLERDWPTWTSCGPIVLPTEACSGGRQIPFSF